MELWTDAVNMALEYDLLEEAKNYAKRVNDDVLRYNYNLYLYLILF